MTAMAATRTAPQRIGTTIRVHAANPWALIITPALITMGVFLLNFVIWHTVLLAADGKVEPDAFDYNGGVSWIMFYLVVVAVQAMNQTFSFTVGLGSTRRDYYLGTALTFAGLALVFGGGIALMAGVERATDGWGVDGHFFAPGVLQTVPLWELAVIYAFALLTMMFVGAAAGAMFVRWGATGLIVFFATLATLVVALTFGIVAFDWWQPIAAFFAAREPLELAALALPIAAVSAVVGFLILRKATPKG